MSLVLDSSATMAWIYADETTAPIAEVFSRVTSAGAWVSSLWRLEVANVLEMGVRKARHDAAFRDQTLADLALLPIHLDPDTNQHAWGATVRLAEKYRLTIYDAAYIELALRRGLPLATLDDQIRAAAKAESIPLLGA